MIEFSTTLGGTLVMHPVVIAFLRWRGILDVPNHRSLHSTPIYRGGGLACLVAVCAGITVALVRGSDDILYGCLGVELALAGMGFADDMGTMRAAPRLVAQLVIGGVAGGLVGGDIVWIGTGVLVVATTVNMVNFMDGINGISGVSVLVWGATTAVLAVRHHTHVLLVIGAVTAGAALGFLPVNAPRAFVFLGDVGSYLFGALIGFGTLVAWHAGVPPIAAVAPLAVYLADTGLTLVRRALRREAILNAHREHVYQRLVDRCGLAHTTVATGVGLLAAAIALMWLEVDTVIAVIGSVAGLAFYLSSPALLSSRIAGTAVPPEREHQ